MQRELVRIGATVGARFRIDVCLGADDARGVFEATDERGGTCAIKIVRRDALGDAGQRAFLDRARTLTDLDSPHLPRILAAGAADDHDLCFIATELLRGADLASISAQSGPLPPERVIDCIHQLARALEAAHERQLFHGTLAPSTLFLTRRPDGNSRLVLLDVEENGLLPRPSRRAYRAPERDTATRAADIYALGHIAYALLAGEPYFAPALGAAELDEAIARGLGDPPSARARAAGVTLPPDFDHWLAIAAALAPDARHPRARDAAAALELALIPNHPFARGDGAALSLVALGRTLPAEDDDNPRPSLVDPLGDTHGVGLALAKEAAKAVADARRARVATPVPESAPPAATARRTPWLLIAAALALLAIALLAIAAR